MKIQRQDGCQAADTLGDLNNELTPRPCDSRAGHFEEPRSRFQGFAFSLFQNGHKKREEGGEEGWSEGA